MKRTIAEYDKNPPYGQICEYDLNCQVDEMHHLFDIGDDYDMVYVYQIKNQEQIDFFKRCGVEIDLNRSFWYVESCYE